MKNFSKVVRDQTGVGRSASLTRAFSLATAASSVPSQAAGGIESSKHHLLGAPDPSRCYHNCTWLETAPQVFLYRAADSCTASQTLAMGDLLNPGY